MEEQNATDGESYNVEATTHIRAHLRTCWGRRLEKLVALGKPLVGERPSAARNKAYSLKLLLELLNVLQGRDAARF